MTCRKTRGNHESSDEAGGLLQCIKCGQMCPFSRADLHVVGAPCVHDSSFGLREERRGRDASMLMGFWRQHLDLKEIQWIRENVVWQRDVEARLEVGELYHLNSFVVDPS